MKTVVLSYPFTGRWEARNSPARRVPSHGSHLMGTTFAIDFVPVDERGRSAPVTWRTALATEVPERFVGFGRPVLAPCPGVLVAVHDGEPDHVARRSPVAGLGYLLGQAARARGGPAAIAGNHVVVDLGQGAGGGPFVLLAHLRRGSVVGRVGDRVAAGDVLGRCGNSGNSVQPHVHVQATDGTDWPRARGLPIAFTTPTGPHLPREREVVTA